MYLNYIKLTLWVQDTEKRVNQNYGGSLPTLRINDQTTNSLPWPPSCHFSSTSPSASFFRCRDNSTVGCVSSQKWTLTPSHWCPTVPKLGGKLLHWTYHVIVPQSPCGAFFKDLNSIRKEHFTVLLTFLTSVPGTQKALNKYLLMYTYTKYKIINIISSCLKL